jgi:hypothetical protein
VLEGKVDKQKRDINQLKSHQESFDSQTKLRFKKKKKTQQ